MYIDSRELLSKIESIAMEVAEATENKVVFEEFIPWVEKGRHGFWGLK